MSRLDRLARMGAAEIAERLAQAAAVRIDRTLGSQRTREVSSRTFLQRHLAAGGSDPADLLARFRGRPGRFLPGLEDPAASARALERARPGTIQRTETEALEILEGRIRLFDQVWSFTPLPDWHLEPITGLRYPDLHWSRIDYLDPSVGGEYKLCWELSRHQHLVTLSRAWAGGGDERFAETCFAHIDDWIRRNPPGRGIHWASSLELAFRMQSWLWALHALRNSSALTAERFARILQSLVTQGLHIERYLSTYYSPNTHLTGEALGLFSVGMAFPELRVSERWVGRGHHVLESWAPIQIDGDGTYFEQSTAYQRYTVDFFQLWWILSEHGSRSPSEAALRRLEASAFQLGVLTLPNGLIPLIGDDDGGRTWPVDDRPRADVRPGLATAALRFRRGDLKTVAADAIDEVAWLMGPKGLEELDLLPAAPAPSGAFCFPQGGLYLSRVDSPSPPEYVLVDCGPHGTSNCGHAHADLLALLVSWDEVDLFIDPGTFTYSSDPALRDRFRSAAAHNTLTVEGQGASLPGGPFQWSRIVHGREALWEAWPDARAFLATHQGFPGGWGHRRALLHVPGAFLAWTDTVTGVAAPVGATTRLHLPPGAEVVTGEGDVRIEGRADVHLHGHQGPPRSIPDLVSPSYRSQERAFTLEVDLGAGALLVLVTRPGTGVVRAAGGFRVSTGYGTFLVQGADVSVSASDLQVRREVDGAAVEVIEVGASTPGQPTLRSIVRHPQ